MIQESTPMPIPTIGASLMVISLNELNPIRATTLWETPSQIYYTPHGMDKLAMVVVSGCGDKGRMCCEDRDVSTSSPICIWGIDIYLSQ